MSPDVERVLSEITLEGTTDTLELSLTTEVVTIKGICYFHNPSRVSQHAGLYNKHHIIDLLKNSSSHQALG